MEGKHKFSKPTHFIVFPLYGMGEILANYSQIRTQLLSTFPDVEPDYFQNPMRLHMSTVMLMLDTSEKIQLAKDTMKLIEQDVKKIIKAPFPVTIEKLNVFGKAKASTLLFAETKEGEGYDNLETIADIAIKHMGDKGLIEEKEYSHIYPNKVTGKNEIKLHMTILNNLFKQNKEKGKIYKFNAIPIIEKYGEAKLGTGILDHIELCMKGTHFDEVGHYICVDKFSL